VVWGERNKRNVFPMHQALEEINDPSLSLSLSLFLFFFSLSLSPSLMDKTINLFAVTDSCRFIKINLLLPTEKKKLEVGL
jgi:hypothetical protein